MRSMVYYCQKVKEDNKKIDLQAIDKTATKIDGMTKRRIDERATIIDGMTKAKKRTK